MTDQHRLQENGSPFFLETSKDYIAINESDSAVFPLAEIRVRNGRTSTHFPSTKMVSESDYCQAIAVLEYAMTIAGNFDAYRAMLEGDSEALLADRDV